MGILFDICLALVRTFCMTYPRPKPEPELVPTPPFHQFSRLPVELRLKIWSFAAPSRVVRIHVHEYTPSWIHHEQRWEGYASDRTIEPGSTSDSPGTTLNLPTFIPGPDEPLQAIPLYPHTHAQPHHIVITPCTDWTPCGCKFYPSKSYSLLSMPGVLLACHESYEVLSKQYRRCLEDEYDPWGREVVHPISRIQKSVPHEPPVTGTVINPLADALHISFNVASGAAVRNLSRFASIATQHIPDIQKVILTPYMAMAPYRFWSSSRFQYWERWGATGWWVPTKHLVKLPFLKEVVIYARRKEEMLPPEWGRRTERLWVEELAKVEDQWPVEWEGKMPPLRVVDRWKDV